MNEERLSQKFWNGVRLNEEETEDLESHGFLEVTTGMSEKGINNME